MSVQILRRVRELKAFYEAWRPSMETQGIRAEGCGVDTPKGKPIGFVEVRFCAQHYYLEIFVVANGFYGVLGFPGSQGSLSEMAKVGPTLNGVLKALRTSFKVFHESDGVII